jgi:transcriptional regulator with XRE-family HTH domain
MREPRTLADRLGYLRSCVMGLTAGRVAELAGISAELLRKLESGDSDNPQAKTIKGLARVYGATAGWVGFGEGERPAQAEVIAAVLRADPGGVRGRA